MLPAVSVPAFGGTGSSRFSYEQQVELWRQNTNLGPAKRASALPLQMDDVARQVCMAAGSAVIMDGNGLEKISSILRDYIAPAAADTANHEVARSLQF